MKKLTIFVLAMTMVCGFLAVPKVSAQSSFSDDPLESTLKQTALPYTRVVETNGDIYYSVAFNSSMGENLPWRVLIYYNNSVNKRYVYIISTAVNKIPMEKFSFKIFKWVNDFNGAVPGSHLVIGEKNGVINALLTFHSIFLSPSFLEWAIRDAAATCEDNYKAINELLGISSSYQNKQNNESSRPKKPSNNI